MRRWRSPSSVGGHRRGRAPAPRCGRPCVTSCGRSTSRCKTDGRAAPGDRRGGTRRAARPADPVAVKGLTLEARINGVDPNPVSGRCWRSSTRHAATRCRCHRPPRRPRQPTSCPRPRPPSRWASPVAASYSASAIGASRAVWSADGGSSTGRHFPIGKPLRRLGHHRIRDCDHVPDRRAGRRHLRLPHNAGPVAFVQRGVRCSTPDDERLGCFRHNPRYRVAPLDEPAAANKSEDAR